MNNKIPQYHSSYTEEQNLILHDFLENATNQELIEAIYFLRDSSVEQEKTKKSIDNLISEIHTRDIMLQKYSKLLACKEAWGKYSDDLFKYKNVLYIRRKYKEYKEMKGKLCGGSLMDNFHAFHLNDRNIGPYSTEYLRQCTFSEKSSRGISFPQEPLIYYDTLDKVPFENRSFDECMGKLGTQTLKYFLLMLLQFVDLSGNENKAPAIITLQTRKYSYRSHKKEVPVFMSTEPTFFELRNSCFELIDEIQQLKEDAYFQKESLNL